MSTLIGIGLDLVDIAQFRPHYVNAERDLLSHCFTDAELATVGDGEDRIARLAARFSVKEAVYKSLGGIRGAAYTDIETIIDDNGAPKVILYGAAKKAAESLFVTTIFVSLTHSPASAAAVALAWSGDIK